MSYFGHICKLPFLERPMGPCPACEYAAQMGDLAERMKAVREIVRLRDATDGVKA